MEIGIPVPNRLSLDFQQELVENIDQIFYLNSLISNGKKEDALEFIRKEGSRLMERYTKICYYRMSDFTDDIPNYPMNEAADEGDIEILEELISIGFDPKVRNRDILIAGCKGTPPLCNAAEKGHFDLVKLLVEVYNCDVNERDGRFGDTPLHYASRGGSVETVQYFVEKGACVNSMNNLQHLPICVAVTHHDICQYLISNDANVKLMDNTELSLLFFACTICNNLDTIRIIIEAGADVNNGAVRDRETTFCIAAKRNWLDLMRLLHDNGADPELGDRFGLTPLHRTTRHKTTTCAQYLIVDLCVRLDKKHQQWGNRHLTPFAMAVDEGNSDFLHLLLDAGYDPVNEECILHNHDNANENLHEVLKRARHIASNPRSLQDMCVFRIRKILGKNTQRDIDDLGLPTVVKDMIKLKHVVPSLD